MKRQRGAGSVDCKMQSQRSGCCQRNTLHSSAREGSARKCRSTRKVVVPVVAGPSAARNRSRSSGFPACIGHANTARHRSTSRSSGVIGAPAAKCPLRLASARSGGKNAGVHNGPNSFIQANAVVPGSHGAQAARGMGQHAVPNPSFKPSPNGRPRWPASAGPSAHFALAGQRVPPSVPA